MPELPEAESIARALDRAVRGRRISKVEVFFPRLRTSLEPLLGGGLVGLYILIVLSTYVLYTNKREPIQ